MKRYTSSLVISSFLFAPLLASAHQAQTISLGYAQTHLGHLKDSATKDLRGLALKYRYEFNSNWGGAFQLPPHVKK